MTAQAEAVPREHPAFDDLAARYDATFTSSALGRSLRSLAWQRLDALTARSRRVLEIGCGTGEDAVHLALRGAAVVATDPSPSMLRVAEAKALAAGCAHRIEFRCLPMERLGAELAGERFDAVWSNFGAINCVARLDAAVAGVADLLEPGAPLAWVVLGRDVPWEWAWFLARGDREKAFRRRRQGGAIWRGMRIVYPTPAELKRTVSAHFVVVRCTPLGVVLPPSYAAGWLERRPRLLTAIVHAERVAQRWQALGALADHYILEARKRRSLLDREAPGA